MPYRKLSPEGRNAVVIGGTSGIGRALALGLAEAGASVVATGRREVEVQSAAKEIEAQGRRSLCKPVDVAKRDTVEALLAACIAEFSKVDILNCAGTTKRTPTLDVSDEEWNRIMECNVTGTLRGCQVFARHMAMAIHVPVAFNEMGERARTRGGSRFALSFHGIANSL